MPSRRSGAATLMAAVLALVVAQPAAARVSFAGTRGISVHAWFTWTPQTAPDAYQLPVFQNMPGALTDAEIARLRAEGFNFVRLTVDPGVFILLDSQPRQDALEGLSAAITRLRRAGLAVIVDLHPVSRVQPLGSAVGGGVKPLELGPDHPFTRRLAEGAAWLAGRLDRRFGGSGGLAFELLNEPDLPAGDPSWTAELLVLHRAVRQAAPRLTLIVSGSAWDSAGALLALRPADFHDANLLYTFHFYEDMRFTHQGTRFGNEPWSATSGLPYPADARAESEVTREIDANLIGRPPGLVAAVHANMRTYLDAGWNRERIRGRMDAVAQWARNNGVPTSAILMGEFGVNGRHGKVMGARDDDRERWLADVRQEAEAHGFRWALWAYRGNGQSDSFDFSPPDTQVEDPVAVRALGLRPLPPPASPRR